MNAVIERRIERQVQSLLPVINDTSLNALEKLAKIIYLNAEMNAGNKEMLDYLHKPDNSAMHQKALVLGVKKAAPILSHIIQQGIAEKIFHTPYPLEFAEYLLVGMNFLFDPSVFTWSNKEYVARMAMLADVFEATLHAKPGSFSFLNDYAQERYEQGGAACHYPAEPSFGGGTSMKVLIIGAGVIGTVYGWALAEAGHSVTHLLRPGRTTRFTNGVPIDMVDRRKGHPKSYAGNYAIKVTETIGSKADYGIIIVPVKHYELEATLRQLAPMDIDSDCILLTNYWKCPADINEILPSTKYVFGDAKAGGSFRDGKLMAAIYAIDLGSADGSPNKCLAKAQELFLSAGLKVTVQENMLHYLWVQYAINAGLWPALVRAGSPVALLKDRRLVTLAFLAAQECLTVIGARGVAVEQFPETAIFLNGSFIRKEIGKLLLGLTLQYSKYHQRCMAHSLADPNEIRSFYYDIIDTGTKLGINMPVMRSFQNDIDNLTHGSSTDCTDSAG
jgi:2-dehydropantoate 2-reductase